mgnify:CR=1 FL=1
MTVLVWSKENCPFCIRAKKLLSSYGMSFEEKKIGENATREDFFAANPNCKTVPQIHINGTLIGGFEDLLFYLASNSQ